MGGKNENKDTYCRPHADPEHLADHMLSVPEVKQSKLVVSRTEIVGWTSRQKISRLCEPGTRRSADTSIGFLRWLGIEAIYGSERGTGSGTGLSLPERRRPQVHS